MPPPQTAELLLKTGYDMSSHAAESADWINVLGAQVSWPIKADRSDRFPDLRNDRADIRFFKGTATICSRREAKKVRADSSNVG